MNKEHESKVSKRAVDSCNDHVEKLLTTIQAALEDDSESIVSFVNEFNDFTIAIPLNGNQEELERFMEKQRLGKDLSVLAKWLVSQIKTARKQNIACCFTGRRPKRISWLSDDNDYRLRRLCCVLQALIKGLALNGVRRFITGNAEGFDTIAAEAVIDCNNEFEAMKANGILSEDWESIELEIAIPFDGHNAGNQRVSDV